MYIYILYFNKFHFDAICESKNLYHWVIKRRSQAAPWHGAWWQRLTVDRVRIDCGLALCSHGGHGGHGASARPGVWGGTWQVKDNGD